MWLAHQFFKVGFDTAWTPFEMKRNEFEIMIILLQIFFALRIHPIRFPARFFHHTIYQFPIIAIHDLEPPDPPRYFAYEPFHVLVIQVDAAATHIQDGFGLRGLSLAQLPCWDYRRFHGLWCDGSHLRCLLPFPHVVVIALPAFIHSV